MTDEDLELPGTERAWARDRRFRIGAIAVVMSVVVIWLALRARGPGEEAEGETPVVMATVETVQVQAFAITVAALGTVEPQPGAEARVAAPAPTVVTRIHVAEGAIVRAGDPLIELDASVFDARVRGAETAREAAQRAFDRAQRLVTGGILPRKDLEAAETDLANANADLTEARRIAALATLRSPIGGVVTSIDAALAQPVDANQSLIQVVNPAALSVLFRLSPSEAAKVARGAEVSLTTPEPSSGNGVADALGEGRVTGISAAVDSASGGVEVRVVASSPTRMLRVGEAISGRITLSVHPNAVVVPLAALVPGDDGVHVFVVDAQDLAHETEVTVGERSDELAEILSGLTGGERIVVEGAYGVADGSRIEAAAP